MKKVDGTNVGAQHLTKVFANLFRTGAQVKANFDYDQERKYE